MGTSRDSVQRDTVEDVDVSMTPEYCPLPFLPRLASALPEAFTGSNSEHHQLRTKRGEI